MGVACVQDFDDSMSGTTAITAFFKGAQFTVANIGDSRAVVGEKKGKRVIAYSLSIDQTPYRQDERERVKASGAHHGTPLVRLDEIV